MTGVATYRRAADAVEMAIDDTLVVVDPASEQMVTLNGVAAEIWGALTEPTTLDALAERCAATYPTVASDRIRTDIAAFLDAAVEIGVIVADQSAAT